MFVKLRRLSLESVGYGLTRMISQSVNLFLIPLYTRLFSPAEYGAVDVIKTISMLLLLVMILGTDTALSLYYYDDRDAVRRREFATIALAIRLMAVFVALGLLAVNANAFSRLLLGNASYASYLLLAFLALPFSLSINLFSHLLRLRFAMVKYNVLSIGLLLTTVGINLYLLLDRKVGAIGIFWADMIAGIIFTLLGLMLTRSDFALSWSPIRARALLRIGLPMLPASLGFAILTTADRLFLLRYSTLEVVGLYAVGAKLSSVIGLATGAFQTAWYPFALSIAKDRDAKSVYAKVLRYYLLLMMTIVILLSSFAREALSLFTSPAYVQAYKVVGILACNLAFTQAYYIVSIGLSLTKNTRHIGWTLGVAVLITLSLDFMLVPRLGMIGAALAPLVANVVASVFAYREAQRVYPIPFEWGKIGKIGLIGLVAMVIGTTISTGNLLLDIVLKVTTSFAAYPVALLLLGCVDKSEIAALRRQIDRLRFRLRASL